MKRLHVQNPNEEIADYMSRTILFTNPNTSVREAAQLMHEKEVGSLLIKDGEEFIGIVTETDFTRKAIAKGLNTETATVRDVMTAPLLTIEAQMAPVEANMFMAKHKIRHLGVVDQGKLVGVLSVRDLVHFYANPRMRSW
ncbi:MAG: CBS domain-containing protein [Nitrospina sp.]|nr:CBS domain-containing protein [Nitrospina sp.]